MVVHRDISSQDTEDSIHQKSITMLLQIDHYAIYAKDIKRLATFYRDILELSELDRTYHKDGTVKMVRLLVNNKQCIELFNYDNLPTQKDGYVNSGYMHLGFAVEDIDCVISKLQKSQLQ